MKVTLTQRSLAAALDPVRRIVEKRGTIPILANVSLSTDDPVLLLCGTDLDREIITSAPADVEIDGPTTIPAHLLNDIVRKLPAGAEITLSVDDEGRQMTVSSGRSKFRLQCLPASDFPDIRRSEPKHSFKLTGDQVRSLFGRVAFAMSNEETRYYLNGTFLHVRDDAGVDQRFLTAVATDGHRLAKMEISAPEGAVGMPGVIVPSGTVEEILKIVGKRSDEVTVRVSSEAIEFSVGDTQLYAKLIDGNFPEYQRFLPTQSPDMLVVDRLALASAVERVSTVNTERGSRIRMALGASEITLSANAPDAGTATEIVDATFEGKPFDIGYNSEYRAGILAGFESPTVQFLLADPATPALITDEMADDGLTVVLMPMRV